MRYIALTLAFILLGTAALCNAQVGQDCRTTPCSSGLNCCYVVDAPNTNPFTCYDPSQKQCISDEYHPISINFSCLCSKEGNQGCCNRQCYDKNTHFCNNGTGQIQPKGECGPFNCPSGDGCCTKNIIGPNLSQCFNPATHHCVLDQYYIPSQRNMCLCSKTDQCCNGVCFDPTRYKCQGNTIVQK